MSHRVMDPTRGDDDGDDDVVNVVEMMVVRAVSVWNGAEEGLW